MTVPDSPDLDADARAVGLRVAGIAPVAEGDWRSVVLLAPDEPAFWTIFRASPEATNGAPDPLDRWSARVVGALAARWGGAMRLPSDGPPWPPFGAWALGSGAVHASPVGLFVDAVAGLWVSFRGAVLLGETLAPRPRPSPCPGCPAPCVAACPVGALTPQGYDVSACHAYLDEGGDCLHLGCRVRRACPVGAREPEQAAFHMRAFHP